MDESIKTAYFGPVEAVASPNIEAYTTAKEATCESFGFPSSCAAGVDDPLTDVIRRGARTLLAQGVEAEVAAWIVDHAHLTDDQGHRQVVRNGHAPPRSVVTGVGPIEVTRPRVHDRRTPMARERFTSKILPPYLCKAGVIAPGRSESPGSRSRVRPLSGGGDFGKALAALVGPECPGLSAFTVVRLKQAWEQEYRDIRRRDLSDKRYVYVWADPRNRRLLQRPAQRTPHLHPGADGRDAGRPERTDRRGRRLPRIRAVVEIAAAGRQATRAEGRSRVGHQLIGDLIAGISFTDGVRSQAA